MEFWTENQGQLPLYSKYGTVPGRNCAHNYHDRHQETQIPLYYRAQQDQGREPSYWTAPGSRTGGAPHGYFNWTDQDLTSSTSSQFPFILDSYHQQHPDIGEYQLHEARDREWPAAQQAAREYDRGYQREGWHRRWESCSPIRPNQEVLTKRSDNSYRELEAWAARYSHSLPRRKRIEAELRGASQGLLERRAPERDNSRRATDPQVAMLQQVVQSANIRESGQWDRGGRQQGPTHYASQTSAGDTSHMWDMKENTSNQRRTFSQPPGYIAPPPYNSPHKSSPALKQCDASLEKEGNIQSYWSQPKLQKQDVSTDLLCQRKIEKEDIAQPDGSLETFLELDRLKHRQQEIDALQESSHDIIQTTNIQHKIMLSLQKPQVLQAVQNKKINEDSSSKVIEGRKFSLNKKKGGMTIFCLVSRIAGTTETNSLPLCTSQANIENTESAGLSKNLRDNGDKLADEVDFRAPAMKEQSNTSDSRSLQATHKDIPSCVESYANSSFGSQVSQSVQPVSVKYPLWREPSSTSRPETDSSSEISKVISKEGESDILENKMDTVKVHPIDIEVRRLDITEDTESEDSNGLLVIDTTCVLVKMELIPSPKKEHVHYLNSTPHTEESPLDILSTVSPEVDQSNSQLNQEVASDQNSDSTPLNLIEGLETQQESDLGVKKEPEGEIELFPCTLSSLVSDGETMVERAERILGIPLKDCITEQKPEEPVSRFDSFMENQEGCPSPTEDDNNSDAVDQIQEDTIEETQSKNPTEVVSQTEDAVCLQEDNDVKIEKECKDSQDFPGIQEHVSNRSEENTIVSYLKNDIKCSLENETTDDHPLESTEEDNTTEQGHDKNLPLEIDTFTQHPDLPDLNSTENQAPHPEILCCTNTPSEQLPPPLQSNVFSQSSTPQTDKCPIPSLDLIDQAAEAFSNGAEDQDQWGELSQPINDEINNALAKDMTDEWVTKKTFCLSDNASCVKESIVTNEQQTNQDDKDLTGHIMEDDVEFNFPQFECVQSEDVACAIDSYMTEEQQPKEVTEDLTGVLQKTLSIGNAIDTQTPMETSTVQDSEPLSEAPDSCPLSPRSLSPSHLELVSTFSSDESNKPVKELVSLSEVDSVCSSALDSDLDADPAEGILETFPPPLYQELCEEYLQPSSSSFIPTVLHLSSSPPLPKEGSGRDSPDITLKEQPQYPRLLRDAVNRIRKHTAPDSENEEEDVSELWDPESRAEALGNPDGVENMTSKKKVIDNAGQQVFTEGSVDEVKEGQIKQSPETCGHPEEDTLSCSSTSSHGSGDTVLVADEDEAEESEPDAGTEINQKEYEKFQNAEEEQCFSCEEKDATAAKSEMDKDEEESVKTLSICSDDCPFVEENKTTKAMEIIETMQKYEVSVPSMDTASEGMTESEFVNL